MLSYEAFYSDNVKRMKTSAIRELLKLTRKPGIISFAGGLPAPDLFPVDEIRKITDEVLEKNGQLALQYGPTEGDPQLREELCKLLGEDGIKVDVDNIVVTTSSQQGLDLVGRVFVSPGDYVLTGEPTYVGGIQAFNTYGAIMKGIPLDDQGMDIEALEKEVITLTESGNKPKFVYVVPDFQNPSGLTMGLERRKQLVAVAEKHDLIIIEDSPYRQLRFEGEAVPPIISLCPERVVALYSFSKILLPGFRLGWVAGPEELVNKMAVAKQPVDLCSPPFNQAIMVELMKQGILQKQISKIVDVYRDKRDFMIEMLEKYMPALDGLNWTHPAGGLFLWINTPENVDTVEMFEAAIEEKVAYVVGSAFYPNGGGNHSMRVNFSFATKEQIEEGIKRLAKVIEKVAAV